MRVSQILLPALIALATAACARQQAAYYVIDPATQQPVPVAQQSAPATYGRPQYAQAGYQQPPAASSRGLFASAQTAPQAYAATQEPPSGRGLFNTYASSQGAPPYPQQAYMPQPAPSPVYAQPAAPPQYRAQPYGGGGSYAAATPNNPYAQARWY